MNRFAKAAEATLGGSFVMNGRTKITMEEIMSKYPEGITIVAFDLINSGNGEQYATCIFKEEKDSFFNAGKVLTNICIDWVKEFNNCEEASQALLSVGGVKFKFNLTKTKKGQTCVVPVLVEA